MFAAFHCMVMILCAFVSSFGKTCLFLLKACLNSPPHQLSRLPPGQARPPEELLYEHYWFCFLSIGQHYIPPAGH